MSTLILINLIHILLNLDKEISTIRIHVLVVFLADIYQYGISVKRAIYIFNDQYLFAKSHGEGRTAPNLIFNFILRANISSAESP